MKTFLLLIWLFAILFHFWTVIIAFQHGFWSGIITLFLPVVSEIYWIFKMFGENTAYSIIGIIEFIVTTPFLAVAGNNKK